MKKSVLGIDIGSYSIKAVEIHFGKKGLEIGACHELLRRDIGGPLFDESARAGSSPDDASPDAATPESDGPEESLDPKSSPLGDAIAELLASHNMQSDYAITSLPSDQVSSRHLHFPFDDAKNLSQTIPFEVEDQIPFEIDEIILDWVQVRSQNGESDILAVFTPREDVGQRVEDFIDTGLAPQVLEPEGLVLANLCELFPLSGDELLIDVGFRKTTLCWLTQGKPLAMRSIPIGGEAITEALAKDRLVDRDLAEDLKRQQGIFSGNDLSSPYESAFKCVEQLAREIQRSQAALEETLGDSVLMPSQIVLMGGGSQLHHLDKFLSKHIGIPTTRLAALSPGESQHLIAAADPLLFAPALALALRGGPTARTQLNFLQFEFAPGFDFRRLAREHHTSVRLATATAALFVLWFVLSLGLNLVRAHRVESAIAERIERVFPGETVPAGDPIQAMGKAVSNYEQRADFLGVYRGNLSALDLLSEVSKRIQPDAGVTFETLQIDRNAINVRGISRDFEGVDRIQASLKEFDLFQQITVSDIKEASGGGGKRFTLAIRLAEEN